MIANISPSPLSGGVRAIASKSEAHRRLILAALSKGETQIGLCGGSDDIDATVSCIEALGAVVSRRDEIYTVKGGNAPEEAFINARESGSTLRFLLPVAAALCEKVHFTGAGRLPERPLTHLINALTQNGVCFSGERLPLTTSGKLKSGVFTVPGNISSQYVTGLLLALPFMEGDSVIRVTGELASKAYVDITLETLKDFGVRVLKTEKGYRVPGGQTPKSPGRMVIEGDWSNAAFFLAAGAVGSAPVSVSGLNPDAAQGDKAILPLLQKFGAAVTEENGVFTVCGKNLHAAQIDIGEVPDLIAPLGIAAAYAKGKTVFYNAERLRLKESDRIRTMKNLICSLGGSAEEENDKLIVYGNGALSGGECDGANDHRIVMAAAIAGAYSAHGAKIHGAQAVRKSYPGFFNDFECLGGKADVL